MRSIRTQLVIWLVGGTLLLTSLAGVGLYSYMEEALEHSLDAALAAKAQAITGAVHMEDDGQPHLQLSDPPPAAEVHHEGPFYFQIWRDDGSTLACFAPPTGGDTPLPRVTKPHRRFEDARLSDGTTARITELPFLAHADEDEFDAPHKASQYSPAHLVLVVTHDRRSIDGPLAVLLTGLLLAAAVIATGILLIVTWGVRRGLRPLAEVSALAERIGPDSLDVRFPGSEKLPAELLPIGLKLNELLDRLSAAFARERRFSAAVAHELRTPLAELRSACDVALRWPDDTQGLSTALTESRDVAIQMSTMVQTLLSLARRQAGIENSSPVQSINLSSAVTTAWPGFATAAAEHQLSVQHDLNGDVMVEADPTLLTAVLRNLLENAAEYAPGGGCITTHATRAADGRWSLHIANTCVGLTLADLSQLFEPFWRADPSRTGTRHAGLGLTLVQAYCEAMHVEVAASLVLPDKLEVILRFPNAGY